MPSRISIPAPCPAAWAGMTPVPGGRHCAACNKVVVDFSSMNTAEATAYLHRHPEACGRFRPEHINPLSSWAPWLAAAVVALTSSCETELTTVPPTVQAVQEDNRSMLLVQGQVVTKGNEPLAHVLIISEHDTAYHVHTAADGTFAIRLPRHLRGTSLVAILVPSPDDFGFYRPRYFPADNTTSIQIKLRNSMAVTGTPRLEPEECLSPAARSILSAPAPPPPPPKLSH